MTSMISAAPQDTMITNPFANYDQIAKKYNKTVATTGEIIHKNNQPSGVFIIIKKDRLLLSTDSTGKLASYPADPKNLGKFLESFWFCTKVTA